MPSDVDYLANLADFSEWLQQLIASEKFVNASDQFIEIHKRLKTEDDVAVRASLGSQARGLEEGFSV